MNDFPPEDRAHREGLPGGYAQGSAIVHESLRTIKVLGTVLDRIRDSANRHQPDLEPTHPILVEPPYYVLGTSELDREIEELRDHETTPSEYTLTINVIRKVTPILRGYVEHVETIRLRRHPLVTYLMAVHGLRDTLDRDHHGVVGWHYHYCNKKGQRSDTMLSFDTNQQVQLQTAVAVAQSNHPLFWERHSESNAKFSARAEQWGTGKRESLYDAIMPDLKKWKATEFRRPGMAAEAVWPMGAILSPPPKSR
jgi:hypothetical protein